MSFAIKRVYDAPAPNDGTRILVDRLWPRGMTKEKAALDGWLKDAAPSTGLRRWFGHEADRFEEFSQKYKQQLAKEPESRKAVETLREMGRHGKVSLLYAARDPHINHAVVLLNFLQNDGTG